MEIITANTEIRCKIPMPQDKNKSKSILLSILKKLSKKIKLGNLTRLSSMSFWLHWEGKANQRTEK